MVRGLLQEAGEGAWGTGLFPNWEVLSIKSRRQVHQTITPLERLIFPVPRGEPVLDLPPSPLYGWIVGHKASFLSWAMGELKMDAFYAVFLSGPDPSRAGDRSLEPAHFRVFHAGGVETTADLSEQELKLALRAARKAGPIVVEEILE
jgi:hypothetical protein